MSAEQRSLEAYESINNINALQHLVYDYYKEYPEGIMDQQAEIHFSGRYENSTIRVRRNELVKLGKIKDSGKVGRTRSGRKATIWVAV